MVQEPIPLLPNTNPLMGGDPKPVGFPLVGAHGPFQGAQLTLNMYSREQCHLAIGMSDEVNHILPIGYTGKNHGQTLNSYSSDDLPKSWFNGRSLFRRISRFGILLLVECPYRLQKTLPNLATGSLLCVPAPPNRRSPQDLLESLLLSSIESKKDENMLDINLFREEEGNNPEIIRESQRRRFANVEIVDEIIHLDKEWRQRQFELEQLLCKDSKEEVANAREDASSTIRNLEETKDPSAKKAAEVEAARAALYSKLELVGNLVHDSVPVSNDKANNVVVRTWGEKRTEPNLKSYVELLRLLGIADFKRAARIATKGLVFLLDHGLDLKLALIKFGNAFLVKRGFRPMQDLCFMAKHTITHSPQSVKQVYDVTGEGDDNYLIANNADHSLHAYHIDEWLHPTKLPLRYVGHSTCLREEAGPRGRLFMDPQFEKVEQLFITSPNGNASWDMHDEIIKASEEFYQMLKLPYQVVSVVSGSLNAAAAKTYDLEAWLPASDTYSRLLSCSNSTDYQSRKLDIRFGQKEDNQDTKQYCHLLNSTLTPTQRTVCCILENFQTETGVEVPEVLQPYMYGIKFMPFQAPAVINKTDGNISK